MPEVRERQLPAGYAERWLEEFYDCIAPSLTPGVRILDIGSGRRPAIEPALRPENCHYVGLDVSPTELELAPAGSYDELWVRDVGQQIPEFEDHFDLIVSWQVLEHIKPLDDVVENLRRYLKPGGRMVSQLSGAFSVFGLANRLIPDRLGTWMMYRLLQREPDTVFPAYYHHCWHGALVRMLGEWQDAEVQPRYNGAGYFAFSRRLQRLYLVYEGWSKRNNHRNLATHYLLTAIK